MPHQWLVHVNTMVIVWVIRIDDIFAFGMGNSMASLCGEILGNIGSQSLQLITTLNCVSVR